MFIFIVEVKKWNSFLWRCHNSKNIMVINEQNNLVVWTIFFGFGQYKNVVCCYYIHFLSSHNESWEESWKVLEHFRKVLNHENVIFFGRLWSTSTTTNPTQKNEICGKHYIFFTKKKLYDEQFRFLTWQIFHIMTLRLPIKHFNFNLAQIV